MTTDADDPRSAADVAKTSYAAASAELDAILIELEQADLDVDHLAERVARAAVLIRTCRERIDAATVEVERIVDHLSPRERPPSADT
jgi:exodeoxyribonuclease VII small subunit